MTEREWEARRPRHEPEPGPEHFVFVAILAGVFILWILKL